MASARPWLQRSASAAGDVRQGGASRRLSPLPPLNAHPMAARDWRVIRAFAGRLRKWANPTRFALFRFVRCPTTRRAMPDDKVLIAGDVLVNRVVPTLQDGFLKNWIRTLDEMQAL